MKILYSAGNRLGASQQLRRFLSALDSEHQIKIAGYIKSSQNINSIDWTLDALFNSTAIKLSVADLLGHEGAPKVDLDLFESLLKDIDDYNPDLVICDGEAVIAHIAKALSLPLWYCSPLHLLDGLVWERGQLQYQSKLESCRKFLKSLPTPTQYLIYSPWGSTNTVPPIKENYYWIQPYTVSLERPEIANEYLAICADGSRSSILAKILNALPTQIVLFNNFQSQFSNLHKCDLINQKEYLYYLSCARWLFTTGETSFLADALYNGIYKICLSPSLQDAEALLNVIMCQICGWGFDVGQVELIEHLAVDIIAASLDSELSKTHSTIQLGINPTLDQKVIEYARSI